MTLAVATASARSGEADSASWNLYGHTEEILCVAAAPTAQSICASGDADGLVLLWRFASALAPEHVCRLRTGGAAAVDAAWSNASTLLVAQGDASASVWDVEKGKKLRGISRYAVKGRCSWPVVNCVTATGRDSFVFGGDDGYLVTADARSGKVASSTHVNVPVTAASANNFSLFVGDVCGALHWFDVRAGSKEMERIPCGRAGITSVIVAPRQERVVTYALDGTVRAVDSQPFALSSADRLLGSADLGENMRQSLLRGTFVAHREAVVLPDGNGDVVALALSDIGGGVVQTVHTHKHSAPVNVGACVQDRLVVCGGGTELAAYEW